jgi:RimJ/RimL family protein N-acetyltransferase
MEMMPYHPELDEVFAMAQPTFETPSATVMSEAWRTELPELQASNLRLRELRLGDAQALFDQLTTEEVARFISPPPASVQGFERFIRWAQSERAAGRYACFVVVPEGQAAPVGMFQIRILDAQQATAEWGFALGSSYWGTGLFMAAARRVVDFAFVQMGMRRLEARACVANGRGSGALRKVGAVCEAVLHKSFERRGERLDQGLWTILRDDWLFLTTVPRANVH